MRLDDRISDLPPFRDSESTPDTTTRQGPAWGLGSEESGVWPILGVWGGGRGASVATA